MVTQFPEAFGTEVRQFVMLPVRPQILHRIQFRSIGGQELQPDAPALLAHEVPDQTAAMALQPIPHHQQLAGNVAQQMGEKLDHLRTANAARKQSEIEVPPRYSRHGRQRLPIEVVLQHRRLAPWSPRTAPLRALAQSTFVDEDDGATLVFGLFFNSGQCFRFHC